ncbi:MAG: hypothetical protein ABH819_03085 [Patescibacteria group bacterium]
MLKILKLNWFLIVGLLILTSVFYWFQVRPSMIRSSCVKIAKDKANKLLLYQADLPGGGWTALDDAAHSGQYRVSDYNFSYAQCLNDKGLK